MLYKGENLCDYCFRPRGDSKFCPHCGLSEFTYTAEARQLPAGTNLNGHYIVGKVLGQGGFGVTYLAFSAAREGIVAIKEYLPASISYRGKGETNVSLVSANDKELFEKGAQRFYEEAKTISQFSNENIISVYEFFYANSTVYYSMEYLEGVDLRNYIARKGGTLSESEIISVTLDVCNALRSLHDANILHRDIAPDNIFRCDNGDIKLIDFGTAKQVVNNGEQNFSVVVKNGFAPIEQYKRDGNQGPWTDIYALGATMYYALTGEIAPNSFERLESPELSFGGRAEQYSPALVSIISKCMAVKSGDRYQSVYEIIRDLEGINAKENEPIPAPVQPKPAEEPVTIPKAPMVFEEVKKIEEAPKTEEKAYLPKPRKKKKRNAVTIGIAIIVASAIAVATIAVVSGIGVSGNVTLYHDDATGKWGCINEQGRIVTEPQFDVAYGFYENGFARVRIGDAETGKWGYINERGEYTIEPQFEEAKIFAENGLASVRVDSKWGYINERGEYTIEPQFGGAEDFANGLARVRNGDAETGKWGYINERGEYIIEPQFDGAEDFVNGLARVRNGDAETGKWGYINERGEYTIEPQFDAAEDFAGNGYAAVAVWYRKKVEFADFSYFMRVYKWGYINKQGTIVIEPQFDDAGSFNEIGLALVRINDKWGCINEQGEFVD